MRNTNCAMSKSKSSTSGAQASSSSSVGSASRKDRFKQTTMGNYMDGEESSKRDGRSVGASRFGNSYFRKWSDKDTEQYRLGYPGKKDNPQEKDNWLFYTGNTKSYPDGDFIDKIHERWWGDFRRLESHHGYIQWLFPIRETGMNFYSQQLQLHEIKKIMADEKAHARVLKSYQMMLHFYGMVLVDNEMGRIKRSEEWRSRFHHLNSSYHNYLRITRILKSLGEFGYEHLKKPFVEFVLQEALELGTLQNCLESCNNFWIGTIKDDEARKELRRYVTKMGKGCGTKYYKDSSSDEEMEPRSDKDRKPKENSESKTFQGESEWNNFRENSNHSPAAFSDDSQEAKMWTDVELLGLADVGTEENISKDNSSSSVTNGNNDPQSKPNNDPQSKPTDDPMEVGNDGEKIDQSHGSLQKETVKDPESCEDTQTLDLSQV